MNTQTQIINQRQWYNHLERIEQENIKQHHYSIRAADMLAPDLVITNSGDGIMRVKQGWKDELTKRFLISLPVGAERPLGADTMVLIRKQEWDDALALCVREVARKWRRESKQLPQDQGLLLQTGEMVYQSRAEKMIFRYYGPLLEVPTNWWQRLCDLYEIPADTKPLLTSPVVICLCGSTRFTEAYRKATFDETLAGRIVLSIGCNLKTDSQWLADKNPDQMNVIKTQLDQLHLQKIDMADGILVINVGGYIGESTQREIAYAIRRNKSVRFLDPERAPSVREVFAPVGS